MFGSGEKKNNLFDKVKEDMMMDVLDTLLPKIKPFIEPAMAKLEDFLGNDEKIIVMRKLPGQKAKVFILDKTKGSLEITNDTMKADPEVVAGYHDVGEFVQNLISGEFTSKHEEQKQLESGQQKQLGSGEIKKIG